jgi:hypothetical protein
LKKVNSQTWICKIFLQGQILSTTGDALRGQQFLDENSIKLEAH